jgi:hypothetical protein
VDPDPILNAPGPDVLPRLTAQHSSIATALGHVQSALRSIPAADDPRWYSHAQRAFCDKLNRLRQSLDHARILLGVAQQENERSLARASSWQRGG